MAIDTEVKRSSVINFGVPWPVTLPPATGTFLSQARAHVLNTYGSDYDGPTPGAELLGRPMRVGVGVGIGI